MEKFNARYVKIIIYHFFCIISNTKFGVGTEAKKFSIAKNVLHFIITIQQQLKSGKVGTERAVL